MKRIILLAKLLFLLFAYVSAQEVFMYNENGEKEFFKVNSGIKYVKLTSSAPNLHALFPLVQKVDTMMPDILKITLKESNKEKIGEIISGTEGIFTANELTYIKDGTMQWCFNLIMLQTKNDIGLENVLEQYEIPYSSYRPFGLADNEYLLELSVSEALPYSNLLYETGLFQYAVPVFYRTNVLQNPYYSSQWGLKNTGQQGGTSGMDINVEPAWTWSTGKDIVVAVIDNGVQLDHPDLAANLLPGYDALGLGSAGGIENSYNNHGTKCAGVIAAINNNIGIKGVAYDAKIIPIRVEKNHAFYDSAAVEAFRYLYGKKVDVISCSWGGGSPNPALTNAIDSMVIFGRNGLGCPVLFSSGNVDNHLKKEDTVRYPASLPNTIAVGAMNPCGERKRWGKCEGEHWKSCYGPELDVIAPGVLVPTTTTNSSYCTDFWGTSAACPHAAGVMALILSANPCLTAIEARAILCGTCDKLMIYPYCNEKQYGFWNSEVGYGKINAYKAVLEAMTFSSNSYQLTGGTQSSSNIQQCVFLQDCNVSSGTYYNVQKYEIVQNITYPYTEHPVIMAQSNGYSGANPNSSARYCSVTNVTNTSATLKTWVYKLDHNSLGQIFTNMYIPVSPSNVWFKATVYDEPDINLSLNNLNITNTSYNRNAFIYLETADFSVQGSSIVQLRAGEEVLLGDGTLITPNVTGDFYAYIQPFQSCIMPENSSSELLSVQEKYVEKETFTQSSETSITSLKTKQSLKLFPNPVSGILQIQLPDAEKGIARITVCDLLGRVVLQKENLPKPEMEVSSLTNGMYLLQLRLSDGTNLTAKFVKD